MLHVMWMLVGFIVGFFVGPVMDVNALVAANIVAVAGLIISIGLGGDTDVPKRAYVSAATVLVLIIVALVARYWGETLFFWGFVGLSVALIVGDDQWLELLMSPDAAKRFRSHYTRSRIDEESEPPATEEVLVWPAITLCVGSSLVGLWCIVIRFYQLFWMAKSYLFDS